MSYLRYLCLFTYSDVQHILSCVFVSFVFIFCLVCPIFPVSLNCSFLIAHSVLYTETAVHYFPASGTHISKLYYYFIFN